MEIKGVWLGNLWACTANKFAHAQLMSIAPSFHESASAWSKGTCSVAEH